SGYLGFHLSLEWVVPAIIVILLWAKFGATPGKMLFKVKIVDAHTLQPASTVKLIGRYLGYFISMIPLCLGIFWVAWDKKKQGFHDKIAQTLVIKN
ncbi:MAG: RDD family protein, partial [Bacteroidales bacterium]|nr:RDD family protein [Candidatus Latescibacterota bacterium]